MIKKESVITSRQNEGVKRLCALSDKKAREEQRAFRFDGIKLYREAVYCGLEIEKVFVKESLADELFCEISEKHSAQTVCLCDELFERVSEEKSPQGVITVAKYIDKSHKTIKIYNDAYLPSEGERVILIESVRDPGNLGTMIRCAAALGVDRLIISSDCADIYNPKTIRAAMGGLFRMRIDKLETENMAGYISALRGIGRRVFAAALDSNATVLGEFELLASDCFVIGNEGHGLCSVSIAACDASVIIPMEKDCESLNAASAATLLMWEQRRAKR